MEGFLSTDTAGDAASRLRSSTISIEDKNPAIDGDDSEPDNSIKPKGKTVKKPVGAKSQKNGQAKVNNFTGGNIHATLAVAKKNVLRGGKGGGGRKPRAAKKTIEPVNPQPPPTTAVDLAAIAESKKMLDEMRKATKSQSVQMRSYYEIQKLFNSKEKVNTCFAIIITNCCMYGLLYLSLTYLKRFWRLKLMYNNQVSLPQDKESGLQSQATYKI